MPDPTVRAPVDHLVYGVQDLNAAMVELGGRLGVRPVAGGSHPGAGTHNALLDLGGGSYLEVIAPDPGQPAPSRPRHFGLDALEGPKLVGWAAKATDLEARVAAARAAGYDPGPATPMQRRRPDGVLLEWVLTAGGPGGDGLVPFLIDWGVAPHPSQSAPGGCSLMRLRARHPRPAEVLAQLAAVGISLDVEAGLVGLVATLETPNGPVELT